MSIDSKLQISRRVSHDEENFIDSRSVHPDRENSYDSHQDWQKDDSDSRCGNRKSFVRDDQLTIFALTADQRLLKFRDCNPTRSHQIGSVYGLQASDYRLVGIDFRVQDGQLYGVGNGGGIYTIDTNTAVQLWCRS